MVFLCFWYKGHSRVKCSSSSIELPVQSRTLEADQIFQSETELSLQDQYLFFYYLKE